MSNAMTAGDAALSDHKKLHKTLKSMIKDSPAMSWDMHWDAHRPPATAPAGMSRSATAPALGSPDGDHRKQPLGDLLDTMSHKKRHHGATMRRITQRVDTCGRRRQPSRSGSPQSPWQRLWFAG